jgi:ribonuclease HI
MILIMTHSLLQEEKKKLQQVIDGRMSKKQIISILKDIVSGLIEVEEIKNDKETTNNIIYVDGGMNTKTGNEAWGSVVDNNGNCLIKKYKEQLRKDFPELKFRKEELPVGKRYIVPVIFNDVSNQQNNGAELIAMTIGLKICEYDHTYKVIYSDSQLIIQYWSKNHISKDKLKTIDQDKLRYIHICSELRSDFESREGKIIKISGKDNKADLGYHK